MVRVSAIGLARRPWEARKSTDCSVARVADVAPHTCPSGLRGKDAGRGTEVAMAAAAAAQGTIRNSAKRTSTQKEPSSTARACGLLLTSPPSHQQTASASARDHHRQRRKTWMRCTAVPGAIQCATLGQEETVAAPRILHAGACMHSANAVVTPNAQARINRHRLQLAGPQALPDRAGCVHVLTWASSMCSHRPACPPPTA